MKTATYTKTFVIYPDRKNLQLEPVCMVVGTYQDAVEVAEKMNLPDYIIAVDDTNVNPGC